MIPLRDSTRSRTFPLVTISLILLNLYFFYQQASSTPPQEMEQLILNYGFTPALLTEQIKKLFLMGFFSSPPSTYCHLSARQLVSSTFKYALFMDFRR